MREQPGADASEHARRGRLDDLEAGSDEPTLADALEQARLHARAALGEALQALRWLVEAGSLATGAPSHQRRGLGGLTALLESAALSFEGEAAVGAGLLDAISEALDQEIERWEERSREDAEARAVLRAFLGLRELLWEVGVRPRHRPGDRSGAERRPGNGRSPGRAPRVQRVPVEG